MSLMQEMATMTMPVQPVNYNGNNSNCNGWGGDWSSWIILFLIFGMFGWGGMGFGGFGGGFGGMGFGGGYPVESILQRSLDTQTIIGKLDGVNQGLCDGFYAMQNSVNGLGMNMMQGFHGVDNAICAQGFANQQGHNATQVALMQGFNNSNVVALQNQNALQTQLADCCCTTQRAIDNVNYNMATNTCAITNTLNNNTRDIIDNANANSRAILDYLCQDKISTLQGENQALRLAASQSNQNAVLMAAMDANKAEILRRTGAECPTAAYIVQPPQPVSFQTNCSGQAVFGNGYGCNNGCC